MTGTIALSACRISDWLRLCVAALQRRIRVGQWLATRTYWILLTLFVELQITDIITTNRALAVPGVWEVNPLMALSQAKLGVAWWLPKLAVVGYLCVSASFLRRRWPIIFAVSISGLAVLGNLTLL